MVCRAIGKSAQMKLLPGSRSMFNHQCSAIFEINGEPQAPCNYMFVSMTSSHVIIGIIRDTGVPYLVNIHEGQMRSESFCGKYAACKEINEVNFRAVRKTNVITGKRRKTLRDALLIVTKYSSNTKIINKTHSLDVHTVQLLIRRVLPCGSLVLQLVLSTVDSCVTRSDRVLVGR